MAVVALAPARLRADRIEDSDLEVWLERIEESAGQGGGVAPARAMAWWEVDVAGDDEWEELAYRGEAPADGQRVEPSRAQQKGQLLSMALDCLDQNRSMLMLVLRRYLVHQPGLAEDLGLSSDWFETWTPDRVAKHVIHRGMASGVIDTLVPSVFAYRKNPTMAGTQSHLFTEIRWRGNKGFPFTMRTQLGPASAGMMWQRIARSR
jgi:hypothetical protein